MLETVFFFLGSINFLGLYTMFKTEFNSMKTKTVQDERQTYQVILLVLMCSSHVSGLFFHRA